MAFYCELSVWKHKHAHCFGRVRCFEGHERLQEPAGIPRLQSSPQWHRCVGTDPPDNQHREALSGKYGGVRSFLHLLDNDGHLWRLRRRPFTQRVQRSPSLRNSKNKVFPHRILSATPLWNWTSLHKITAFSQILTNLQAKRKALEDKMIKASGEDVLHLMVLRCYTLKLAKMPKIMARLCRSLKSFCHMSRKSLKRSMT